MVVVYTGRADEKERTKTLASDRVKRAGSGGRAAQAIFNHVATVLNQLTFNNFTQVRINRIECTTDIENGRRSAEIDAVELDTEMLAPGETLKGVVFLRPYKGARQRVPVSLTLPADMPEGNYTATIVDGLAGARHELRDNPNLGNPLNVDSLFAAVKVMTAAQRTDLVVRVPLGGTGVALEGATLPNLPPSMVQILGNSRRTGAQTVNGALVSRRATDWVIQGSDSVRFTVAKQKRFVN